MKKMGLCIAVQESVLKDLVTRWTDLLVKCWSFGSCHCECVTWVQLGRKDRAAEVNTPGYHTKQFYKKLDLPPFKSHKKDDVYYCCVKKCFVQSNTQIDGLACATFGAEFIADATIFDIHFREFHHSHLEKFALLLSKRQTTVILLPNGQTVKTASKHRQNKAPKSSHNTAKLSHCQNRVKIIVKLKRQTTVILLPNGQTVKTASKHRQNKAPKSSHNTAKLSHCQNCVKTSSEQSAKKQSKYRQTVKLSKSRQPLTLALKRCDWLSECQYVLSKLPF
ncbi:hypothetical protein U1Q18_050401 [Sarracenia purpurea var. burkii]